MIQGNYPPPKWEVVHNDQTVTIPVEIANFCEGKGRGPTLQGIRRGELTRAHAIIDGGEGGGVCEQRGRKDCNLLVVLVVGVEIWSTRQGIGFVSLPWEVYEREVVVRQSRDVPCYSSIDVLRVSIVFEVFVVCINCDRVGGPDKEVSPVGQSAYEGKQFSIMNVVIPFCRREGLRVITHGFVFSPAVALS